MGRVMLKPILYFVAIVWLVVGSTACAYESQTRSWQLANVTSSWGPEHCLAETGSGNGREYTGSGSLGFNGSRHDPALYICSSHPDGLYRGVFRVRYVNRHSGYQRIDVASLIQVRDWDGTTHSVVVQGACNAHAKNVGGSDRECIAEIPFELYSSKSPNPTHWTVSATPISGPGDLGDMADRLVRDIGNAPSSVAGCTSDIIRCAEKNVERSTYVTLWPAVEAYKKSLFDNIGARKKLPEWLIESVKNQYPEVDLNSVIYVEDANTIHGQNITWENHIFFVRKINFKDKEDLRLVLHELEHVVQYKNRGGYKPLISEYIKKSAGKIVQYKSINIHDMIDLERAAIAKASAVLPGVYADSLAATSGRGGENVKPPSPDAVIMLPNQRYSCPRGGAIYGEHFDRNDAVGKGNSPTKTYSGRIEVEVQSPYISSGVRFVRIKVNGKVLEYRGGAAGFRVSNKLKLKCNA